MFETLISTRADKTALALRLSLAVVMFPHGAQKLLGWFGGPGLSAALAYFESLGIPAALGVLVVVIEFFGPMALLVGAGTRVVASGIAAIMVVAAVMVHLPNGFFMNWFGNQPGEGIEFHILGFAIALAVAIKGSGALSLDARWSS